MSSVYHQEEIHCYCVGSWRHQLLMNFIFSLILKVKRSVNSLNLPSAACPQQTLQVNTFFWKCFCVLSQWIFYLALHFKYALWGLKYLFKGTGSSLAFASVVISSLISACSLSRVAGTWHLSWLAFAWCLFQARSVFCQIHCVPLAMVKCQGQISPHIFYLSCNPLLRRHYYTD